jgi:hypothetical protein
MKKMGVNEKEDGKEGTDKRLRKDTRKERTNDWVGGSGNGEKEEWKSGRKEALV